LIRFTSGFIAASRACSPPVRRYRLKAARERQTLRPIIVFAGPRMK